MLVDFLPFQHSYSTSGILIKLFYILKFTYYYPEFFNITSHSCVNCYVTQLSGEEVIKSLMATIQALANSNSQAKKCKSKNLFLKLTIFVYISSAIN
jgi:hypothetical protein